MRPPGNKSSPTRAGLPVRFGCLTARHYLGANRLNLFRETMDALGSVAEIAECLLRERSAVTRDVNEPECLGLATVAENA